jgi:hypothetical protein
MVWPDILHRDADLAVRLEPAYSRAVSSARIDDNERPPLEIDLDALGWNDPHERIIHRIIERAAIHDQFGGILQNMRRRLGNVLPILIAAPTQDIQEQHASLSRIDHVFYGGGDKPRHRAARQHWFVYRHGPIPLSRDLIQCASAHGRLI